MFLPSILPPVRMSSLQLSLALLLLSIPYALSSQTHAKHSTAAGLTAMDQAALKQALDAYDQGHMDEAEPSLRVLATKYPKNFEIAEGLGGIYAEQGLFDKALPYLKSAASLSPGAPIAHANLGTAYLKLGRHEAAVHELQIAVRLDAANAQTQEALGQCWMELKEPAKAVAAFSAALRTNGNDPDLIYDDALAQFDAGNTGEALSLLARMPGAESSAQAQSLYGDVEEKLGHYKESAQHYANAVQLDPTEANTYLLGLDFLRHWTLPPAISEFEAGTKRFPDSQRMRFGLGMAYYGSGNYNQAVPVFADLLQSDPDNTTYAELLGRICTVLTEGLDPRCAAVLTFAEQHPGNAVLSTYAANSILHRPSDESQLEVASHLLAAALKADPASADAHYSMGVLLQMKSKWQESIPELQSAITTRSDYAQAHYRLALAYSHTGRKEEATKEVALQQQYSQRETKDLDARMKQITTLLVNMQ